MGWPSFINLVKSVYNDEIYCNSMSICIFPHAGFCSLLCLITKELCKALLLTILLNLTLSVPVSYKPELSAYLPAWQRGAVTWNTLLPAHPHDIAPSFDSELHKLRPQMPPAILPSGGSDAIAQQLSHLQIRSWFWCRLFHHLLHSGLDMNVSHVNVLCFNKMTLHCFY